MRVRALSVSRVGPIGEAEIRFGDLTVLVGPQATGKSILLQFLKLLVDTGAVLAHLRRYGLHWERNVAQFLDIYLGEGMGGIWREGESRISLNGLHVDIQDLVSRQKRNKDETLFYIPAQRVLTLRDGWPRPFSDYSAGDPFAVRDFSEKLRLLLEGGPAGDGLLFPQTRRLRPELRDLLAETVFSGFGLQVDERGRQKRLVLGPAGTPGSLPFMVWSAGQREFVPLLLGFYWLLRPTKTPRRDKLQWAVIEELEAGLHPKAIASVLLVVLDLLARGYRVCLSTHSPHVLDLVWALKVIQSHGAAPGKLLELFGVRSTLAMNSLAETVLTMDARVYFFDPTHGRVADISGLDPGSAEAAEAGWGGLTEFSGRVADVVADVVGGDKE
jgi:hypothetical protein